MKKHIWGLVVACAFGLAMVLPQLFFIYQSGSDFKGVYMFRSDAELHYLARMSHSSSLGSPFLKEDKDSPTPLYTVSEQILALPGLVFGISVPKLSLFYKFLLPAIIYILVYFLAFRLTEKRLQSVLIAICVTFGAALLNFPDLVHLFRWEYAYGQFSIYSRPVNPQFSSIFFFAYLHVLLSFYKKKDWETAVSLGMLVGVSFYIYFYLATFLLVTTLVSAVLLKSKKLAVALLIGLGWGIAALVHTLHMSTHPFFADFSRVGDIVKSHRMIVSNAFLITLCAFVYGYPRMPYRQFVTALLITTFLVVNQQVITGSLLQEGHFHWYYNVPIYMLVLCLVFPRIVPLIAVLAVASTVLIQSSTYHLAFTSSLDQNKYAPVFEWLNAHTPRESVVFANNTFSALVPVYTHNLVFWEDHASYYLLSPKRREYTAQFVLENFAKRKDEFELDYVVRDNQLDKEWKLPFLKEVYKDGRFVIYEN